MAERTYLHIGTMKAASTFLQSLFDLNRDVLVEHGISWQSSRANQLAVHDFMRSRMRHPQSRDAWRTFARDVRKTRGNALISMELLAALDPGQVGQLVATLGSDEVTVFLTARHLTGSVPSHWQERTQNRQTVAWADWIEAMCDGDPADPESRALPWRHHYLPEIVRKWSTVASPEGRVSVVTIPRDRSEVGTVWQRVAEVLGVPAEDFRMPTPRNAGLGATSAELMRRVNARVADLDFESYRRGFKSTLAKQTLAKHASREPKPMLTGEQHARLREIALRMLDELRGTDVEIVGDIDDLVPPPEPPASAHDPGTAAPEDLLDVAVVGLAGLGRRVSSLQEERDKLERRNRELAAKLEALQPGRTSVPRRARALPGRLLPRARANA